ncbi:MAG: methyltransferase domain-containing protein [Planctomycetota bacterium]|nr:methyltransferase domain-containing protein [Planctomycetota bacterium]
MSSIKEYVLGTDAAETQRLELQHRLWSDLAHQTWKNARIGPGATVLDIGCGPGFATIELAQLVGPAGRVVAVDESETFIDYLRDLARARGLSNIETHVCDVQKLPALNLRPSSFDLTYARWVLCFVPDPAAVVRGAAELLKPGGRFSVNDYFNYESMTLAPRNPAFSRAILAVGKSWRDRGGDCDIVGRLSRICSSAGLLRTALRVEQRLATPGDSMWFWPDSFWKNYVPRLVQSGHLTTAESDDFHAAWRAASADPDAFMMLPPVFEFIAQRH